MGKEDRNQRTKKKPSQPKPDGLKPNAKKWKKKTQIKKQKKIHHILNPTDLNQRQYNGKRRPKSKNKKNPSQPENDGLKPKGIKWKKKTQIKKRKKSIIA